MQYTYLCLSFPGAHIAVTMQSLSRRSQNQAQRKGSYIEVNGVRHSAETGLAMVAINYDMGEFTAHSRQAVAHSLQTVGKQENWLR